MLLIEFFSISWEIALRWHTTEPQCSTKISEKWDQMTHPIKRYGTYGVSPIIWGFTISDLKFVEIQASETKIIGDIPDFDVLNVHILQPPQNPGTPMLTKSTLVLVMAWYPQAISH